MPTNSPRSHFYTRRPLNAQDPFAQPWADGHPHDLSESHLYFSNAPGTQVFELPYTMSEQAACQTPLGK